jgi:hypothetical protein
MADAPAVEDAAPNAALARYANPLLRLLFRTPLKRPLGRQLAVLRFTGRRSGRTYCFPVGVLSVRGRRIITSRRSWQWNFNGGVECDVLLDGRWQRVRAERVADVDETADLFGELIDGFGRANAPRRLGLRVNVDRAPTHEELVEAVRRIRLSIIHIDAVA